MDLALSSKQALFPTSHVPATMFLPHGGAVAKEKPLEPLRQLYALYMKIPHFPRVSSIKEPFYLSLTNTALS